MSLLFYVMPGVLSYVHALINIAYMLTQRIWSEE